MSAEKTMKTLSNLLVKAVQGTENVNGKWFMVGDAARAWYGTEDKLVADRTWVEGIIVSGLSADQRAALAVSKTDMKGKDEAFKTLRKNAQSAVSVYWSRVLKYAFPKEKTAATARPVDERIKEALDKLIAMVEKAEDSAIDLAKLRTKLGDARAVLNLDKQ